MNIVITLSVLLQSRVIGQVLLPLHPHPNTIEKHQQNNQRRTTKIAATKDTNDFQNSAVYEHLKVQNGSKRNQRFQKTLRKTRTEYRLARGKPNNTVKQRKNFRSTSKKLMSSPLPLFQGLGSHYVTAYIGTPPQRTTLLVDTGSDLTATPVDGCDTCGKEHTDKYFKPKKSSTFHALECNECERSNSHCSDSKCMIGCSYLEGSSWSGYEAKDAFYLGEHDSPNRSHEELSNDFTFACQVYESGLFQTQLENGIMGLINSNMHLPSVLKQAGKIANNQFSLCFGWELDASLDGIHSGLMTLGGLDTSHHKNSMVYAKNVGGFGYGVKVRKVYLRTADGKKTVEVPASYERVPSVIVDSGTTVTYLSSQIKDGFYDTFAEMTGFEYPSDDEVELTKEDINILPTILIQIGGSASNDKCQNSEGTVGSSLDKEHCNDVLLEVPPSHYLFSYEENKYSFEFHFEDMMGEGGIIGANSMQRHDVFFDNDNMQIGFAKSDCSFGKASSQSKKKSN